MTINPKPDNREPDGSETKIGAASSEWTRILWGQAILAGSLALLLPVLACIGWTTSGGAGVVAAFVAFFVCWIPNSIALMLVGVLRDPQQGVHMVLVSMLLRMGLPMAFAVVLMESGHWLVDAHVLEMVLASYLVALVVETLLSLWTVGAFRTQAGKAS